MTMMFGHYYRRTLLCCLNLPYPIIRTTSPIQTPPPSFSLLLLLLLLQRFSSTQDERHSFTTNYLINNCGLSPETASKLSNQIRLRNSDRLDSVLALFRSHGFSDAQISGIIRTFPKLLTFDPQKTILPKLNFLLSKGASSSDLVHIVAKSPAILCLSLERNLTPGYDFVKRFLLSDESTIHSLKSCVCLLYSNYPAHNIQMLLENGVPESKVALVLRNWCQLVTRQPDVFKKAMEEVKELGFIPNTTPFMVAMRAKIMEKSQWEKKIDLYKKWGWSEETIASAFVKYPWCMLASENKIEAMMEFLVNRLGWESLMIAEHPILIMASLERRIIPRASVLQFLESRSLIKDAKSARPFQMPEKVFLQKFVNCFGEEASQLLKLYEEKRDLPR